MVEIMVTMTVEITTGGHASPRPPTCYVLLLLPMFLQPGQTPPAEHVLAGI